MSEYWSQIIRELKPYVPGEQPKDNRFIKLNTNENPYPPSPNVIDAIHKETDASLRRYPDAAELEAILDAALSRNVETCRQAIYDHLKRNLKTDG